jgi:enoyl-CoA hydratase
MSSILAPLPYENLRLEKKDQIAYLTLARPKALNALNGATVEELSRAFAALKQDAEIRAVILTGEGDKAFAAGADIRELVSLTAAEAKEYAMRGQLLLELIENLGKPVIACVNGFALGGGCELAMACTIRLASPNASFGQPEVKLGLTPGYAGTQRLPRLIGKGRAMQMVLTAEAISAQEAHRIGLVNEVVPQAELISRAEAIVRQIIANAPLAVQFSMEAVNKGMEMTAREGGVLETALFATLCATDDKAEGTRAFLEKRPPRFSGK